MRTRVHAAVVLSCLAALGLSARADISISDRAGADAFPLVDAAGAATLVYSPTDATVVGKAAALLASDIARVTEKRAPVLQANALPEGAKRVVYIGTLGQSPAVDAIIRAKNIDTRGLAGQWEAFRILRVPTPAPGVEQGLLVIGSDRRGTAYGVMELSERMGVSPWEWWADVAPAKRPQLHVSGEKAQGPPSVKYRGIFINDEDFGLQPWAAKTFEPETKDIGPKTYAKVFELLLRLRANYCWPAMHDCTKAFNLYPQNKQIADDYAIVMGSSHCEPMLRNNVTEWPHDRHSAYNYVTNRDEVLSYWRKRVEENGKFENVYTLGMRGIHDSDMLGGGTRDERAQRLNAIMRDQRQMIADLVNKDVAAVPQIFCPYKEVLLLYQAGAVPPEDVTFVWADDNHGYIRNLSTPEEQRRRGGSGVYYHLSYWGRPHDWLWLDTLPPSLVWQEMSKAYDYGARTLWVFNVGDIKPQESGTTLALRMAYDIKRYTRENIGGYVEEFARETFGEALAKEIGDIKRAYYRLNFQRKPEHTGFNYSQNGPRELQPSTFTDAEILSRLSAFDALVEKTNSLQERVPTALADAYFQLVAYPVRGSALQNEKMLSWDMNRRAAAKREWDEALRWQERSMKAFQRIAVETRVYNDVTAGGKWKHMMTAGPRNLAVWGPLKYADLPDGTGVGFDPTETLPTAPAPAPVAAPANPAFVEKDKYLSIGAEHFTRKVDKAEVSWQVIPELGRVGHSMAVFPTTAATLTAEQLKAAAPVLEYAIETLTPADAAAVTVQAVPTHRINRERGLRYGIAINDEAPQLVDLESPEMSATWDQNVLRGAAYGTTTHRIPPGRHTLRIYMVDPGVVLDHVTIDLGGLPKSYLPPPETFPAK